MLKRPLDTPRATARRAQLLEAGFEVFADHDYDDVQLEAVTTAVGCSHGLLFQYFGSKKGFYLAIVEHLLQGFLATIAPSADAAPGDRLSAGLSAYIGWATDHPRAYVSIMRATSRFTEIRALLDQTRGEILRRMADAIGLDATDSRVRLAFRGWIGGMEDALLEHLHHPDAIDQQDLIDYMRTSLVAAAHWAKEPPAHRN